MILAIMNVYVNNMSAMHYWCMVHAGSTRAAPCSALSILDAAHTISDVRRFDLPYKMLGSGTLHVLVESKAKVTRRQGIKGHVRTKPFPKGALRRLGEGMYIASPELCFLEMATELPFVKLVEFGCLLCGTYTVNSDAPKANDKEILTNKRRIELFVRRMGGERGCAIAMKALSFVVEGSASPRETKLVLLLCLPVRMGGYGLAFPQMNKRIYFSREEQMMFGCEYVELDLYWPKLHFAIEYDGKGSHSEERDVSRDRSKDGALAYLGIKCMRVDKRQLSDEYGVQVVARKAMRTMGMRWRTPTDAEWRKKQALFDELMKTKHDSR